MNAELDNALEMLCTRPGQGGVLEQLDKVVREQQRAHIHKMLDEVYEKELPVIKLEKSLPQVGRKNPAVFRFYVPTWCGYDELFWQALGDYVVLALHSVKDVAFDSSRGKITIEYFDTHERDMNIQMIIAGLMYLIDTEVLPADFTRFRRMAERKGTIGEMSIEQGALIGALMKVVSHFLGVRG